jgi:hypothetical protein
MESRWIEKGLTKVAENVKGGERSPDVKSDEHLEYRKT